MVLFAPLVAMVLAQAPTTPLVGMIVGPDGRAVAGAELVLAGMPVYDPPILARGRSDDAGRFMLERTAGLAGQTRIIAPALWVVKPGFRLSFTKFPGPMPGAGEPVQIVLQAAGKAEVRVEGSGGEPVAGARVRIESFGREATKVPDAVADLIAETTDQSGVAVVGAAANDEVAYVDVHSALFGIQGRPFFPVTATPKTIRLRPAAALEGRLEAEDRRLLKGWHVRAYTRSGDPTSPDPATNGYATGTTDEAGHFSFSKIAPGALELELEPPAELSVLPDIPASLAVTEGRENSVTIPLRKSVTITGIVRERGSGRPVPGAEMSFGPLGDGKTRFGKTDAHGRYIFPSIAGEVRISLMRTPPTHVARPVRNWKDFKVVEGAGRIDVEPMEVVLAAPPLQCVVRDTMGNAVPGATVTVHTPSSMSLQNADQKGEFTVAGVAPGAEVTIDAHHHDLRTNEPVKATAGGPEPVIVTLYPGSTLAITGRVLGPNGTPVANAAVRLQSRHEKGGRLSFPEPVRFDNGLEIRTAADGRFQTPKVLYQNTTEFRAEVIASGFLRKETVWAPSKRGDAITLPDLVLRPAPTFRVVSGRIVDREGRGVAGAKVFEQRGRQAPATTTGDDGGYRLAGVSGGQAFLFAEQPGYRFGGVIVGPTELRVDLRLTRTDEPPRSLPKSLPPTLTRANERAIARDLIVPLVLGARARSLGFAGDAVIPALARVDPERVLAMLENRVLTEPDKVLIQVALAQLEDNPAAAIASLEADRSPAVRAEGFLALADATPPTEEARRADLINRALAQARKIESVEVRLQTLGQVADRWLSTGAVDRAKPIVDEGRKLLAALPHDQYSAAAEEFARVLAVIDLAAARAIIERKGLANVTPADQAWINRQLGEAAVRLAAIDPAQAESLVPTVVPNFWTDSRAEYVLRISRSMAPADLPRARRILDSMGVGQGAGVFPTEVFKFYGLGLMAERLTPKDPAGARILLDQAFAGLRQLAVDRNGNEVYPSIACVLAGLLPLVERLDPERLEERLWLTASCPASLAALPDMNAIQSRVILAALVARYDRTMAAAIIAPSLIRLPELLSDSSGNIFNIKATVAALAAYDPRAIDALLQAIPDSARRVPEKADGWNAASLDAQLRLAAAEALGLPVHERRFESIGTGYHPWPLIRAY